MSLPHKVDHYTFTLLCKSKLNAFAGQLNERPRKALDFEIQLNDLTNLLHQSIELANTNRMLSALRHMLPCATCYRPSHSAGDFAGHTARCTRRANRLMGRDEVLVDFKNAIATTIPSPF